jgi:hypothetical protein
MTTGRAARIAVVVAAGFAVFGLALDGFVGAFQPVLGPGASEGVRDPG